VPSLTRPDGVEIHWEQRGEGPLVVLAPHFYSFPGVYSGLVEELAGDHRVLSYDARGSGKSTRVAPRSLEEDGDDLAAVAREAGGDSVVVGQGDGADRGAMVAVDSPDLVRAVVVAGATVLPPEELAGVEGLSGSAAVLDTLTELAERNFRSAVRGLLQLTNPSMTGDELRARVDATAAHSSEEAGRARAGWLREKGSLRRMRALGDRLWIARWESEWSPPAVTDRLRELLPEARMTELEAGPLSRPDLTAGVVRRAVAAGGRAPGHSAERPS
jgi:pimeloyl-ACP methyl ester carboxylesterase